MRPRKTSTLLALILPWFVISGLDAAAVPQEFQQFSQLAVAAAQKQGAEILVKYDAEKKLLQIARRLKVNEFRTLTQVQSVRVSDLADEAELVTIGVAAEPWLKIRCRDNKKKVQINSTQTINSVEDEELSKEERLAFVTLPCHPTELKKVQTAYAAFKQSVSR